ncbi:hypothetical protein IJJ12_02650, partial [bacterium]|nr:hypothetical protein [bacterium]
PLEFATKVTLDREECLKNLSKASVFSRSDSNTVKMSVSGDKVTYTAQSLGDGSFAGEQMLIDFSGEPLDISFNIKYLQDFMNTQVGETITFGFNGPASPAMVQDPGNVAQQYIAMPFKPKN